MEIWSLELIKDFYLCGNMNKSFLFLKKKNFLFEAFICYFLIKKYLIVFIIFMLNFV